MSGTLELTSYASIDTGSLRVISGNRMLFPDSCIHTWASDLRIQDLDGRPVPALFMGTCVVKAEQLVGAEESHRQGQSAYRLLGLVDGKAGTCADVQSLAARHLGAVRAKIADLQRIEKVLTETVSRCTGEDGPECAVIDALTETA